MQTMNQSLATLYQKRLVTLETALMASSNRDELQDLINRGVGVVANAGMMLRSCCRRICGLATCASWKM